MSRSRDRDFYHRRKAPNRILAGGVDENCEGYLLIQLMNRKGMFLPILFAVKARKKPIQGFKLKFARITILFQIKTVHFAFMQTWKSKSCGNDVSVNT